VTNTRTGEEREVNSYNESVLS